MKLDMNLILLWGCQGMVSNNCATYYATPVLASTSVIHGYDTLNDQVEYIQDIVD